MHCVMVREVEGCREEGWRCSGARRTVVGKKWWTEQQRVMNSDRRKMGYRWGEGLGEGRQKGEANEGGDGWMLGTIDGRMEGWREALTASRHTHTHTDA